jgi:glycosyltransferase involved in cell wall biosynthesis
MRIAMIGQKGLPATFGGVEHHVEELGSRLSARGHDVTAFCREGYSRGARQHGGVHLRSVPTVRTKHLDAIVHSGLSTLLSMIDPPDVIHYHALGPGLIAPLPRFLSRSKVVLTVHGLDHQRAKWGWGAQTILRAAAWMSARVPDATIGVSSSLADHYRTQYRRSIAYIPNGVVAQRPRPASEITSRFGLVPGSFVLFVGRLVPEKAPLLLIRAFRRLRNDDMRLVIVGGSSFTDRYAALLRDLAEGDPRVLMTGYLYGSVLEELYSNAAAFVLPSSLEGLPLTLLEAISFGSPVVVSDIPPHVEIVGEDAPGRHLFPAGNERSLAGMLASTIADYPHEREHALSFSHDVTARYRWEDAVRATEALYERLLDGHTMARSRVKDAKGIRRRSVPSLKGTHSSSGTRTSVRARR